MIYLWYKGGYHLTAHAEDCATLADALDSEHSTWELARITPRLLGGIIPFGPSKYKLLWGSAGPPLVLAAGQL